MNPHLNFVRKALLAGVAGVALTLVAGAAQAENAEVDPTGADPVVGRGLEEIIVTARRTTENLQRTPIAVSAFSAAELKSQSALSLKDIQYQTPGLMVQASQTEPAALNYQIRGQYQVDSLAVLDAPIGLYQDGIYTGSHVGSALAALLDVERVEVLKGPQGTLYGRNTTGGAISIYSKLPVDKFEGEVHAGIGNEDRQNVGAILNVPLVAGKAALRVIGEAAWDGGYGTNLVNGKKLSNPRTQYVRGTLKLDPTDSFEAVFRGDYSKMRSDGTLTAPIYIQPGSGASIDYGIMAGVLPSDPADPSTYGPTIAAGMALFNSFKAVPGWPYAVEYDHQLPTSVTVWGISATLSNDFGPFMLKSMTSYRKVDSNHPYDFDSTPLPVFFIADNFGVKSKLFTQEFQLTGKAFDDRLKYVLGAFYAKMNANDISNSIALPVLAPTLNAFDGHVKTESPAVYGQATFDITPTIHLTGGLRWTKEKRSTSVSQLKFDLGPPFNTGAPFGPICDMPSPIALPNCSATYTVKDTNLSYTAGLDWNVSDVMMLYVRTARGFKSGGVNERISSAPESAEPFKPEIVTDYEVGLKSEFLDRHVRVNTAFYHSDYTNLQRAFFAVVGGSPTSLVQNAGKATIDGLELDVQALPVENLALRGTLAWTKPKYKVYQIGSTDLSDTKFPLVSEWTYSLSGAYTVPLAFGDVRLQLDWSYRSSYNLSPLGDPAAVGILQQKGYGLLNGQISLDVKDFDATVRIYGKNLANKKYWDAVFDTTNANPLAGLGIINGLPSRPRTFGVEVIKRF